MEKEELEEFRNSLKMKKTDQKELINEVSEEEVVKPSYWKQNLLVFVAFGVFIFCAVWFVDTLVMPELVHTKQSVFVPSIIGEKVDKAEKEIYRLGLSPKQVAFVFSKEYEEGIVLNQKPEGGITVKQGREIYLTISKGREKAVLPDLRGMSIRQAGVVLHNSGFELGEITYEFSETLPRDSVMLQSKSPGISLDYGSKIDLTVSKGSELNITIPMLIGKEFYGIAFYIEELGFALGDVNFIKDDTFEDGTIIEQNPAPDSPKSSGTKINLTVVKNK